jgi:hypothetical protein
MNCYEIKTHKPIFANQSIHSSYLIKNFPF